MNNNFSFVRTISGPLKSKIDDTLWDKVLHLYENEQFAESVRNCINYIDPTIENKYANPEKTEYTIPHGSIVVSVKITGTELAVEAPFLSIESAKKIPILRQTAQINFTPLTISQIVLEDDKLYFRYSCPLDSCEPYKVYDVLREICINADNYDDEFITKFDAGRIREPKVTCYSQEQKDIAWNTIQLYIREAFSVYEQFENKRMTNFLWDVLVITLLKIDYLCAPQGNIRNEIEKTLNAMNGKEDYYQRLSAGKEFLKKIQSMERSAFENDLYKIDVFVSYKFAANLDTVRTILKYAYETADKEIKALDYAGAVLTLQYGILNLMYSNNAEDSAAEILTKAMEETSGKPIQEASKRLFEAVQKVMTENNTARKEAAVKEQKEEPKEEKGFFKKLFKL
ncbi:MAG: hypothetical protein IPM95_12155 [Sphingobacteriales bacterium]|nr:hypothetical protein [Sphingobacteriales bacterium]